MSVFFLNGKHLEGELIGVVTPHLKTFREWERNGKPGEYFKMISSVNDTRSFVFDRIEFAHDAHMLSSERLIAIHDDIQFRIKK